MTTETLWSAPSHEQERFERWWGRRGEWVEAPNQRRGGQSGVQRLLLRGSDRPLYIKRQQGHTYRSLRYPLGRPTVLRERDALLAFEALGVGVPQLRYCDARKDASGWRALLVSEALHGYISLEQWYVEQEPARRQTALHRLMLQRLAETLSRLHRGSWQHGCCYAKHVFVRADERTGEVRIALLDLEKSRRRWNRRRASQHDLAQLRRHGGGMPDADWALFEAHYWQCFTRSNELPGE